MPSIRSFDNTKIYYVFHKGKRDTLLFVHGWPHNHTVWEKEIKHFSKKGFATIALDLRGHGLSGRPKSKSSYTMESFAKDIKAIILALDIKHPILIGHSFGGMILLKFEELFPKSARCLIFVDTTYENPLKDLPIIKYLNLTPFTRYLLDHILEHKHLQKKLFREIDFSILKTHSDLYCWIKGAKNTSLDSLLLCLKDMLDFNERSILSKTTIPCLIIEGEKDHKTPLKVAKYMQKKIPGSDLAVIRGATHDTNIRNPRQVNRVIEAFLYHQGIG